MHELWITRCMIRQFYYFDVLKQEMISGLHLVAFLMNLFIGYYPSWGIVTTFPKCINAMLLREEENKPQ